MRNKASCIYLRWHLLLILYAISGNLKAQEDSVKRTKPSVGVYPVIGYAPQTKLQLGAISFIVFGNGDAKGNTYYRPTTLSPYVIYTFENQLLTALKYDFFFDNSYNLDGEVEFRLFPLPYYGIGNQTDPGEFERYTDINFSLNGRFMKIVRPKFFAGLQYDIQFNELRDIVPGGRLETERPAGINGGRNIGLGAAIEIDSRDNTLYPSKGIYFNTSLTGYSTIFASQYDYLQLEIDYRKYFEFLGPKNLVAFQVRGLFNTGRDIPFYKLPRLGGQSRMRGIDNANLYRDRQMVYTQIEGRQELFWRFGGVLFIGAGQVFDKISNFEFDDTRIIYGLGGRFRALKDEKLNIRIDLGFTDNGQNALYVSVREAF